MKICKKCQIPKLLRNFWQNSRSVDGRDAWCADCKTGATKKWRALNPKKISKSGKLWRKKNRDKVLATKKKYRQKYPEKARQQVRNAHKKYGKRYRARRYFLLIEARYGVTKEQFIAQSKKQGGRCAICHKKQKCGKRRRLYVDHSHLTGKFRGLACFSCNLMLGAAKDSIKIMQAGIQYLRRHR